MDICQYSKRGDVKVSSAKDVKCESEEDLQLVSLEGGFDVQSTEGDIKFSIDNNTVLDSDGTVFIGNNSCGITIREGAVTIKANKVLLEAEEIHGYDVANMN